VTGHPAAAQPGKRHLRQAEEAYLAGAKQLERDDLDAAEEDFKHALALDPEDSEYAMAISVTRQHRVTELVQQSGKARLAGDQARANTLLTEARSLDPLNPIVTEHLAAMQLPQQIPAGQTPTIPQLPDRSQMLADSGAVPPWIVQAPALAPPIHIQPAGARQSFHLRGTSHDVLRDVASGYGISTVIDDSVETRLIRFDLDNATYDQAMAMLFTLTRVFAVPLDETTLIIARDNPGDRQRLERQVEETIYLPDLSVERVNELANIIRTVFEVKQATVQASSGTIVVRAPEEVLAPMNRSLQDLTQSDGELMIEIKVYEVSATRTNTIGATVPAQAGIFSVAQAATQLVNANQALVQQAIAQGLISSTASNIDIALALIGSGLVQSTLASSTIGTIGGGLTLLGITASTNTTLNLGQNSTDTRSLDDLQIRVGDHQAAILREGTRYPIITSTYTTGLSTAASALGNASINGVSVASLLSQFAGGSSATIPQVTYEDLGITLEATPTIQTSGRINLLLKLKIEALAGTSANGNPTLASRQFNSDITIAEGDSAMLVSNVNRTETAALTGLPGLSELPGFQLPNQENTEKDTGQLVVIVTPHIVRRRSATLAGPRISVPNPAAN
jgi:general secretion pathway protein D